MLNPVRAGMVSSPASWRWSSYRATAGTGKMHPCLTVEWVLIQFSENRQTARTLYKEFVNAGLGQGSVWKDIRGQSILGSDEFVNNFINIIKEYEEVKEIPRTQRFLNKSELKSIFSGIPLNNKPMITEAAHKAVHDHGHSQKEIADYLGVHYCTVSRMVNTRCKTSRTYIKLL